MKGGGMDGNDMKDKDMKDKDEKEIWKGRIPIRPLLKAPSSYPSNTAASPAAPVMGTLYSFFSREAMQDGEGQEEEGMEIKEVEALEKEEEREKLTEKEQDDDDCDDEEMEGKGVEESHGKSQDVLEEMKKVSGEMGEVKKRKHREENEERKLKSNIGLTTKSDMDQEEKKEEKKEEEEINGRSSSSLFHLPTILNVVHDFR